MVFTQEIRPMNSLNSKASPTPVTDGERVYAAFYNGYLAAVDFEGNVIWTNTGIGYESRHGFGASPIIYGALLIIPINPTSENAGFTEPWDGSFLWALDKNTGEERWRGTRTMSRVSHSTPVVIQVNGEDQILSMAGDVIQGFEPATGELIWTVRSSGEPAVPTPAIGDGMIFTSTRSTTPILGIRTDGKGDVTDTHVLWQQPRNSPMVSSFLYVSSVFYTATESGSFTAFDAATGDVLWEHRLGGGRPDASPIYADGKIYVTTREGITTVLRPNANPRTPPEVVAINDIGEIVQATLAIAGNQLFLRTETELWCIGE
jgi:outer membrane protein assembly factor BamB